MIMKYYEISCSNCWHCTRSAENKQEAIRYARKKGWKITASKESRMIKEVNYNCLCPDCLGG